MPTIRKRGDTWQAQVRRAGYPAMSKSFSTRADALAWAREKERSIDRAELPSDLRELKRLTVADLLKRYEQEITPRKRGAAFEQSRIRTLLAHKISQTALSNLSGATATQYRDDRLKVVKPPSVRRELVVLRHVFEVAMREWGLPIRENPCKRIRLPQDARPRERRLLGGDESQLYAAIGKRSSWYLRPFLILLVETGMRRGELLSIRWRNVDFANSTVLIQTTKNGHPRRIPLTPTALTTLEALPRRDARVFPITTNAIRLAWERLRARAGLTDLHLHDLRHEAVSRFFELGLSVPEVATISGHRDPRMLSRYTHLQPERLALKLQALSKAQSLD
ncbi:integrase [Bradyrhizobium diazoefficiens]|uniref:Integrase n=2 Tax=Nitrobacteraceae TaxID=41294 RepID=A0A810B4K9_9BRAD|nr:site-specific integrase [Bradyrhizobium diazoefficiens]BCE27140.1 integrase [Bradyrhizobium diazoefficiens]BCE70833.1 integrase [Bradyrhizobium diazoefficiens]BCF14217.1 integrase [Bradyrhizobium diazoefficiens]BCF31824.1 integrase [Bradyrhizobium diazoefficiens]